MAALFLLILPLVGLALWMRSILQSTPTLRWGQRVQLGLHWLQGLVHPDPGSRWLALARTNHDPVLALVLVERAAAAGNPEAHHELGLHQRQSGLRDETAALAHFRRAAEGGHPAAAFQVGEAHRWGLGAPRDAAAARTWHERAARAGYRPSVQVLATALETGDGLPSDPEAALRWQNRLAQVPEVPEDHEDITRRAFRLQQGTLTARWARKGLEGLDALSERIPGRPWMFYASLAAGTVLLLVFLGIVVVGMAGFFFVPAIALAPVIPGLLYMHFRAYRPSRTLLRMERMAGTGDAWSAFRLGMSYKTGTADLPRDHALARQWLRQAAEAGHAEAMVHLADLWSWGSGGPVDTREAQRLLEKARSAGVPEAGERLARLQSRAGSWEDSSTNP